MKQKKITPAFIILLLIFFVMIYGFIASILCSIPVGDDFSMATDAAGSVFLASIERANWYYFNWGGQWPYFFIQTLMNPLTLFEGDVNGPGYILLFFFGVFLFTLAVLVKTFLKQVVGIDTPNMILGTYLCVLACVLNSGLYNDVFYFFVGNCYLQASVMMMIATCLMIMYFKTNKTGYKIALCIEGFIATFFYAQSIFVLVLFMACIAANTIKNKKFSFKRAYPFFFLLAGAAMGAFAPGNFVRKSGNHHPEIKLVVAIKDAVINTIRVYRDLLLNPIVGLMFVVLVMIGYFCFKKAAFKAELRHVIAAFVLTLAITQIGAFPVALGYGDYALPSRVSFFLNTYTILGLSTAMFLLGGYLREKGLMDLDNSKSRFTAFVALAAFAYAILTPIEYLYEQPIVYTYAHHKDAEISKEKWLAAYEAVANYDGEDVVIDLEKFDNYLILGADFDTDWGREQIGDYYGKKSITVNWIEKETDDVE